MLKSFFYPVVVVILFLNTLGFPVVPLSMIACNLSFKNTFPCPLVSKKWRTPLIDFSSFAPLSTPLVGLFPRFFFPEFWCSDLWIRVILVPYLSLPHNVPSTFYSLIPPPL